MTLKKYLRRSLGLLAVSFLSLTSTAFFTSCEDNVSPVGGALASGEVQIALDSLVWDGTEQFLNRGDNKISVTCPKIPYTTLFDKKVDSRSTTNLLGRLSVPEYGDLRCSFVSRLMCASKLDIPDSIPLEQIDSMKLVLSVPRGQLTGDSLAPQQLRVFRLTKSLPSGITNEFDPTGYYDPESPIGSRSYTLSALGMNDSIYKKLSYINIDIPMSQEMARETVEAYRKNPEIFAWPQTFEEFFHGIYVEPSFGRGCVANIEEINFILFYNYKVLETVTKDDTTTTEQKTKVSAVGIFQASPIVLNSNNIAYTPSGSLNEIAAAEPIITTPGGYRVSLKFPGKELVDIYKNSQSKLAVVSDLIFSIPAEGIENDYGLTPPPYLLMVKTSKLEDFLANNSLPDNKDSFYASYSTSTKKYTFTSMRQYILNLIQEGINDEDLDFTIIPADLTFDDSSNDSYYNSYYSYWGYGYGSSSSTTKYLTKCTPYIAKPTMCRLHIDKAQTIFTYSLQQMK